MYVPLTPVYVTGRKIVKLYYPIVFWKPACTAENTVSRRMVPAVIVAEWKTSSFLQGIAWNNFSIEYIK
jgi:hypothetical protein